MRFPSIANSIKKLFHALLSNNEQEVVLESPKLEVIIIRQNGQECTLGAKGSIVQKSCIPYPCFNESKLLSVSLLCYQIAIVVFADGALGGALSLEDRS